MDKQVSIDPETTMTPADRVSGGKFAEKTHPTKVDRLLPLGGFGKRHVLPCRTALVFRRKLEALVTDDPSVIPPMVAILIDDAVRHETALRITQKLMRTPGISAAETSGLLSQFLKYAARRDAAVRKLLSPDTEKQHRERLLGFYGRPMLRGDVLPDDRQNGLQGDAQEDPQADDDLQADDPILGEDQPAVDPSDKKAYLQSLYARRVRPLSAGDDPQGGHASVPQAAQDRRLAPGRPRTPPGDRNASGEATQDGGPIRW